MGGGYNSLGGSRGVVLLEGDLLGMRELFVRTTGSLKDGPLDVRIDVCGEGGTQEGWD